MRYSPPTPTLVPILRSAEMGSEMEMVADPITLTPLHWHDPPSRRLVERLVAFRHALFTCLTEEGIPPDNNHAERVLRKLVVQRKISGGNRSPTHAIIHGKMMSVLETFRLEGGDLVGKLQTLFTSRIGELSRQ